MLKKGSKLNCDVLIIDEWQNMSSDNQVALYRRIKRKYTIGLSATPIRKKGQNFYPLEKTIFGFANPNNKFDWQKAHGKMVYDPFTYSKEKWEDFRDYERYVNNLPNFFRWEEIEEIENAVENNGYEIKFYPVTVEPGNPETLDKFRKLNLVTVKGETAMAKQSFGRNTFERYLNQAGVEVDFPKIKPVNADTYNIGNYTVTENGNVVSVTDQETGLSAYLNRDTGLLTDIDGTVSYVKENNGVDYISAFSSSNLLAIQDFVLVFGIISQPSHII